MSAASTPGPSRSMPSSSHRYTLFWPLLIFLLGSGVSTTYQIISMQDRTDEVNRAIDQMEMRVKAAQYEKSKFFSIAKEVLQVAPSDPKAEKIVTDYKLRQLQAAQPELLDAASPPPSAPAAPNAPAQSASSASSAK